MLVGLHACTYKFPNVLTKLRKLTMGTIAPPPPRPSLWLRYSALLSLVIIALLLIYIIVHSVACILCKFNAGCLNGYDYLLHGNINDSKANDKTSTSRKSICESLLAKFLHLYV